MVMNKLKISTNSQLLYLCPTFIDPEQWTDVTVTLAISPERHIGIYGNV